MSDRRPGILGRVVKWFIVPIALAAIGVFGIGPYLTRAQIPAIQDLKPKKETKVVREESDDTEQKQFGEPEVNVTVAPSARTSTTHHRRRHRRKTTQPKAETDTTAAAPTGDTPAPPPASDGAAANP